MVFPSNTVDGPDSSTVMPQTGSRCSGGVFSELSIDLMPNGAVVTRCQTAPVRRKPGERQGHDTSRAMFALTGGELAMVSFLFALVWGAGLLPRLGERLGERFGGASGQGRGSSDGG